MSLGVNVFTLVRKAAQALGEDLMLLKMEITTDTRLIAVGAMLSPRHQRHDDLSKRFMKCRDEDDGCACFVSVLLERQSGRAEGFV